ncbi:hypothetical protein [Clostridium tagluense]|uniref:Uncharacterized protein n=1 Tax=Clostridium tagluense TaxID=360422 RepID=A0A401ULP2_9CLOT|nr:hypothetical protein [Clostridium tagluense]GCD10451.1 hypothetical protein Ctaglu_20740 [Clostridium tagluense]
MMENNKELEYIKNELKNGVYKIEDIEVKDSILDMCVGYKGYKQLVKLDLNTKYPVIAELKEALNKWVIKCDANIK